MGVETPVLGFLKGTACTRCVEDAAPYAGVGGIFVGVGVSTTRNCRRQFYGNVYPYRKKKELQKKLFFVLYSYSAEIR